MARRCSSIRQKCRSREDRRIRCAPSAFAHLKGFLTETLGQNLQRVGLSTLNDILNVVAPPISEHEVIQIWLSHDMQGYDGVESVVYKAFAKVCICWVFL